MQLSHTLSQRLKAALEAQNSSALALWRDAASREHMSLHNATLKVGPWVYTVKIVDDLKDDDDRPCHGAVDHETLEIQLEKGMKGQRLLMTLLHEILHILDDQRGLELEEKGVCALEDGLTSVVLDNLKIVQGLVKQQAGDRVDCPDSSLGAPSV